MKKLITLFMILPVIMFAACAAQATQDLPYCPMPIYFDSVEQLVRTINEVKSKTNEEEPIVINAKMTGKQTYNAKRDMFKLAAISEFYKPKDILSGLLFNNIVVNNEYVSFDYVNEDQVECATFTWFREMSPGVAMNGLNGREIEHNGITYIFQEWFDPETSKSSGYSVRWVAEGIAYAASIPSGYTDDEMLAFCQFEAVPAE